VKGAGKVSCLASPADAENEEDTRGAGISALNGMRALCHDLIDPAATIRVLVHAACAETNLDPVLRDRLQMIAVEAGRIGDICRQVLDRPSRPAPVRLDVLAAEALQSVRSRYKTTIELVTTPVTMRILPAIIIRILGNLLANACRAAGPEGQVRLLVALVGDRARLAVADSGAGFDIGRTGRASLGLEIVGSLVLDCGGTVEMGTSDLGGLSVAVTFPCPPLTVPPPREPDIMLARSNGSRSEDAGRSL